MKKNFILFIVIILTLLIQSCSHKEEMYRAGKYQGVGQGHHGPIRISIITDAYNIKEINIIEEYEMPELARIVYDKIPTQVIKKNSTDVDVVAGASYTSRGLIEAIKDGLDKAYIDK